MMGRVIEFVVHSGKDGPVICQLIYPIMFDLLFYCVCVLFFFFVISFFFLIVVT